MQDHLKELLGILYTPGKLIVTGDVYVADE
jgi:hypothetical protein